MKRKGLAGKNSGSSGTSARRTDRRFVICVKNTGYPAALELRKLYILLPDPDAEATGMIRVIDESGEDYLYPTEYFAAVDLPESVEEAVLQASA